MLLRNYKNETLDQGPTVKMSAYAMIPLRRDRPRLQFEAAATKTKERAGTARRGGCPSQKKQDARLQFQAAAT